MCNVSHVYNDNVSQLRIITKNKHSGVKVNILVFYLQNKLYE